ncbi:MAG: hypothetical protein ACOYLQ_20020 [Hyphomicrobiaceae bacterium]
MSFARVGVAMREHLFLCGLTDVQCQPYGQETRLSMQGVAKNVRLKVDNLRDRLSEVEPDALTDLLEIAAYVFRADNSVSRESRKDGLAGAEWRRTFRMVVAVREPGRWSEPSVVNALGQTLHFLSDDTWHFEFVDNRDPLPLQYYLPGIRGNVADIRNGTTVVLFSGGLDSFSGAVHELQTSNRHVVLASHRTNEFIGKRQRELAGVLKKDFSRRVTHVRVDAGAAGTRGPREHSQRTRSFLFLAVAAVAARIEESDRIRFYENGIMSAHLPISEQVVGTHASRSTHPRAISLFNTFLSCAIGGDMMVDNPFSFDTKFEVVQRLKASPYVAYIKNTLSCSATRKMEPMYPHCGECKQCIERRLATLGAGAADFDPELAYRVKLFASPRQNGKARAMAVDSVHSALGLASISEFDFAKQYAGELAWLLSAFPHDEAAEKVKQFHALFQRHGKRVEEIFQDAVIENRAALVSKTLSPDSLLWLAIEPAKAASAAGARAAHDRVESDANDQTDAPLDEEGNARAAAPNEIVLLTDSSFLGFKIDGVPQFSGSVTLSLLSYLVQEHRKDRNEDRELTKYRSFRAKHLADVLRSGTEDSVRKVIERIRHDGREGFKILHGVDPGEHALIERTSNGYRLNPRVRIVLK